MMKSPFAICMLIGLSVAVLTAREYGQAAGDPGLTVDNALSVQDYLSAAPSVGAQARAQGDKIDRLRCERPGVKA